MEGRIRARIVCPVVKRSCSLEDATIFRGAFGGTRQRGSFHVSASREYRRISLFLVLSLSCRETSVSRLYSTRRKKPFDHRRPLACSKRTGTISVRKKGRPDAKLYPSFAPPELSSPQCELCDSLVLVQAI